MIVFFNDTFLEEEFFEYEIERFKNSIKQFIEIAAIISEKRAKYSHKIPFKADNSLKDFFALIEQPDLATLFLLCLDGLNVKFWNASPFQNNHFHYYFLNATQSPVVSVDVANKTLAEIAENRKSGEKNVIALNLPNLRFDKIHQIVVNIVSKSDANDVTGVYVECADCSESLGFWLDRLMDEQFRYPDVDRPPRDTETCLLNSLKFKKIELKEKPHGRQVYVDGSSKYWYVDNYHHGAGAHIEVFDRHGKHIGEASLNGEIDTSKVDKNKHLDVS